MTNDPQKRAVGATTIYDLLFSTINKTVLLFHGPASWLTQMRCNPHLQLMMNHAKQKKEMIRTDD